MGGGYWIYGLLVVIALVSVANTGYSYAEPIYLPLIKYYQDNTLFQEDSHISLLSNLPLYTWQMIGYITNSSNLEWFMFLLFILVRILLCFSIYFLAFSITKDRAVSLISTTLSIFVIWTFNIGNFIIISSDITPFSIALLLSSFSIGYFIRKEYVKSLLLLSSVAYVHALTAFYVGFVYFIYFLFNFKEIKKNVVFAGIVSLIVVLPVILKSFSFGGSETFNFVNWLNFVMARSGHHIFPSFWDLRNYVLFSLLVIFFFISIKYNKDKKINKTVFYIGLGTFIMLLAGYIFSEIYPLKEIIQLSLFRSLMFFRIIMFIYASNYIYNSIKRMRFNFEFFSSLFMILLFMGAIFGPVIFGNGFSRNIDLPWGKNINSWEEVSLNTKEFTSKNALIITPPFEESFEVFSERSNYFSWTTLGSFLHFPDLAEKEFNKLVDLCGPFDKENKSSYEIKKVCESNMKDINENKLMWLKEKYGVTHIILKNQSNFELDILFKNEDYALYKL